MNSSLNIILSIFGIGIAKTLYKGSRNIEVDSTEKLSQKIASVVKITDQQDSVSAIRECFDDLERLSVSDPTKFINFRENLSWMRNAPYNEPYYVELTLEEFWDAITNYYDLFVSWHSLPFLNLHSSSTKGIALNNILATETSKNKLHQFRDLMYKNNYTYLSAYYSLKQLPFVPDELKPYQLLFAKAFLQINKDKFNSYIFDKNPNFIQSIDFFESERMMERTKISSEERSLRKTITPKQLSIFDDDFNSIITRIRSAAAIQRKPYIDKTLKENFSNLSLPNVMPPKEFLILFWSYVGELQVRAEVTHLWKERQHE